MAQTPLTVGNHPLVWAHTHVIFLVIHYHFICLLFFFSKKKKKRIKAIFFLISGLLFMTSAWFHCSWPVFSLYYLFLGKRNCFVTQFYIEFEYFSKPFLIQLVKGTQVLVGKGSNSTQKNIVVILPSFFFLNKK